MSPKPLRIRFGKIDGMIIVLDAKVKHLILLVMDLINKKRVLQILLIITLEQPELIQRITYLLKNINFS